MSPGERDGLQEELAHLRERNRKLAEDRAYLQLILRLIESLDPLPGLGDMLRNMLLAIVEGIGGTNIKLYYWVGERLHYLDFLGARRLLDAVDDPDVAKVQQTRTFLERQAGPEEALLMHGLLRSSWTWTFPLLIGPQLVGVIKLENLHVHGRTLGKHLPAFFSHAALILGNEIRNDAMHRLNRELRALGRANEALLRAREEGALLEQVCRIVCEEAGYRMAWVGFAEQDAARTLRPVAWAGHEEGYLTEGRFTWANDEHGRGPSGAAVRGGQPVFLQDFLTDPSVGPWREAARLRGYRSLVSLPLQDQRRTFGVLCIYSGEPCSFDPNEARLLGELAADLAFGVAVLRARTELRDSEERLARTERIVHVGYVDRDLAAGRVNVSEEALRVLGLEPGRTPGDLQAWNALWLGLIHPDDRAAAARALEAALAGAPGYDVEYRVARPDGEVRFVHSRGDSTCDASGRVRRLLGTLQDVTERRRAADEIRELNQRLEQRVAERTEELAAANRELEAFAYSVSHDLRAPLRAIDGFRNLLAKRTEASLDATSRHYLDCMSASAQRMGNLIDDLLSFSRMGRTGMTSAPVDLAALAREVIEDLAPEQAGREVRWRVEPLPVVRGDRALLRMVLVNLLANALKFSRPRAPAEIAISSRKDPDEGTVVCVRDNGVGFDMTYVGKLFGVFQRLHRAEEFEGTGIGLATVRRIVARHGGRTWAEGTVGAGAAFHFSLPDPT